MGREFEPSFVEIAAEIYHAAIGRALGQEDPRQIYEALRKSGLPGETARDLTIKIQTGELGPRDPAE